MNLDDGLMSLLGTTFTIVLGTFAVLLIVVVIYLVSAYVKNRK